ncbi:MAG: dihydropteroate synthase [Myxococcales bacterium]|nr:dihydropteroate synthase [Myxococcales bacterium]
MTERCRIPFRETLARRVLIQDGAKGTSLLARGLGPGELPDAWNLSRPEEVLAVHRGFVEAGCDIVVTNTFGSVRPVLTEHGLAERLEEINRRGAELARQAAGPERWVAGSVPPLAQFLAPQGALTFEEARAIYREQVRALIAGGVDLFNIETASDLMQSRAAVMAIREECDLPIVAMMSFGDDDRTLLGTTPQAAAITLAALGADAVGANCSTGIREIYRVLLAMSEVCALPKIAQPNAGLPGSLDGALSYPLGPEDFAGCVERLVELGTGILGGCCGTTPAHIRALRRRLSEIGDRPRYGQPRPLGAITWLCSRTRHAGFGGGLPLLVIGERINPTRRKVLREALRTGDLEPLRKEAREQLQAGVTALDVNVGAGEHESAERMAATVDMLQAEGDPLLVLDSSRPEVIAAGLARVPGKALINSVCATEASLRAVLPLARKFGAAVIGLCLDENGVPCDAPGRLTLAERILRAALAEGLAREDVLIDPGTLPLSASPEQPAALLHSIETIKDRLKLNTVLGLSNISHGLPGRPALNAAFLAIAVRAGLDAAILDPTQTPVRDSIRAADYLCGRDPGGAAFLKDVPSAEEGGGVARRPPGEPLAEALLSGAREELCAEVERQLGLRTAQDILQRGLLPAMAELGRRFKAREVFLPQVMAAAEAMQAALLLLSPRLASEGQKPGPLVLLATVEGDVHDIGKNIVGAMLRAAGYRVLDLGRSVPAGRILDQARENGAALIGLSALMTTTMRRMEEVAALARQRALSIPLLVGGAVVTEGYARSIGVSYAPDAVRAVDVVRRMLGEAAPAAAKDNLGS